jgi:hypothetical protein
MQRPRSLRSPRKSPKSRVNHLKRKSKTAKNASVFGGVMPRVKANRREILPSDIPLVNNFIRSGGQITGMKPIEPDDVERVIRYILDNNGKIPPSHRFAYHSSSTAKKPESFRFSSNK